MKKKITKEPLRAPSAQTLTAKYNLARPPKDTATIRKLAAQLLEWVRFDDALRIEQFPILMGYTPSRFFKLAENDEVFAESLEIAREVIGVRLQLLAQERKVDWGMIIKILPLYNKAFRDMQNERWERMAKSATGSETSPITVYIDGIKNESN